MRLSELGAQATFGSLVHVTRLVMTASSFLRVNLQTTAHLFLWLHLPVNMYWFPVKMDVLLNLKHIRKQKGCWLANSRSESESESESALLAKFVHAKQGI